MSKTYTVLFWLCHLTVFIGVGDAFGWGLGAAATAACWIISPPPQ